MNLFSYPNKYKSLKSILNIFIFYFFIFLSFFNCLSLKPPTITFTQSPTAAEKQMLGEGKDIERDGWILSSVRTSSTGSEIWEKEYLEKDLLRVSSKDEIFIQFRTLAYFAHEIRGYKKKGFVGETLSGKLAVNPRYRESIFREEFPPLQKRIEESLKIVNESRTWVTGKRIENLSTMKLKPEEIEKKRKKIQNSFYEMVESGEFYEEKPGVWKVKD